MLARSPINQKATGSKIPYVHEGSNETGTDYAKMKQKSFKILATKIYEIAGWKGKASIFKIVTVLILLP